MKKSNTADSTLAASEPILKSLLKKMCRRVSREDRDDIAQNCRIAIWKKIIPAYRPDRGAKLTTFLHDAIHNQICDELSKLNTRHRPHRSLRDDLLAPDVADNNGVELLAADFIEHPERYLCRSRAKIITTIIACPDASLADIAAGLNVTIRSIYNVLYRIRKELIANMAA